MLPYIGGKSRLSSWIIQNFPANYKDMTYCEPFGGGGWVLYKKEQSQVEVYNDLNRDLVNLFKFIRDDFDRFQHKAEWSLHSREMYNEARKFIQESEFLPTLERAMHYAILRAQSFSGRGGWGYEVLANKLTSGRWMPFLRRLSFINARLKKVQIESLDFEQCIAKYDSPKTLFYCDPPYVDAEFYYKTCEVDFKAEDHIRLAGMLRKIKGKFVLSYYDHWLIRELYPEDQFTVLQKTAVKSSQGMTRNTKIKEREVGKELLIMNF